MHDWKQAPDQYGAIHFHDDDLYDAGWAVDFSLTVPDGLKSGVYCARVAVPGDEDLIPFFVRPKRGTQESLSESCAPTVRRSSTGPRVLMVRPLPRAHLKHTPIRRALPESKAPKHA